MGNQPFNVIVILFWLATMSWLVVAKILPPLRVGDPPNYASILEDSRGKPPACWTIRMQGKTIGWAANKIERRNDGTSEIYSRVYLGALPLAEFAPGWLASALKPILADLRSLDVDKRSRFAIDPLGRLVEFESRIRFADLADVIKVQGQINGSTLTMTVTSDELSATMSRSLSPNSLLGDELSPQARMPGLRVGQTWTVPLYSPFRSPNSPLEILQATVEREDRFLWDGGTASTRVIVYRSDAGSGVGGGETRGRTWVRDDGVVLRQEVSVFRTPVQFDRLADGQAEEIWQALANHWNRNLPGDVARGVLERLRTAAGEAPSGDPSRDTAQPANRVTP
jgi:hypothetical protein